MVESAPDKAESHYFLASALYAKGDISAAHQHWIVPANRSVYFPCCQNALASLDLANQKPKLAMSRFEALLAKNRPIRRLWPRWLALRKQGDAG